MKRNPLWLAGVFAVFAAAFGQAVPGQAAMVLGAAVSLSELIANNETVVAGDKEFSDFTYSWTNDMPDASGVNVIPIQDNDGNYGIRFQGAFIDDTASQGGSDALITYNVMVTDPMYLITDAHIAGNPNLLGTTGSMSVTETFLPLGSNGQFLMEIFDDEVKPQPQLVDWTFFDQGYKMLSVQKDILAFAGSDGDATMSFVDQTFSQEKIPEPAALALLGMGVFGMVSGARRRP